MIDEQEQGTGPAAPSSASDSATVAFCQQCGRGLTATSRRQIGNGTFCEFCAAAHQAGTGAWAPVPPAVPSGARPGSAVSGSTSASEPNPLLGGFLGLIPGVGAMYNGQYAKGVVHLVVFVVLVSLADNANWVFWWFVWGWVFYQAFEAYHTAQARRDGLPLPDPFGWNNLGERLGFSRGWPPATGTPQPHTAAVPVPPSPISEASVFPVPPPPAQARPFGTHPVPASSAAYAAASPVSGFSAMPPPQTPVAPTADVPYAPTYTGAGPSYSPPLDPVGPAPVSAARRFPAGAAWLIGLGLLFLFGNLLPAFHIEGRWLVPILLAVIALWLGSQRLTTFSDTRATASPGLRPSMAEALLGPALLLTVAVLLVLQDAYVVPLRHSWPLLLIVWGALLLAGRAAGALPLSQSGVDTSVNDVPPRITPAPNGSESPLR